MLSTLKMKIYAIGAAIIAVLIGVIKFLSARNKSLKEEVKAANSQLQYREKVDTIDAEIEQDFSHRAEEARKDVESGEIPDHLADPSNN